MSLELSPRVAEKWLDHFEDALDDLYEDITSEEKDIVRDHMRYTAYFLVAAQLQQKEDMGMGVMFLDWLDCFICIVVYIVYVMLL